VVSATNPHGRILDWPEGRDNAVGVAIGYGLDDQRLGVPRPGVVMNFLHVVQTDCGAHPASYRLGTGGGGVKATGS
jgi:hypothetical protein